MRTVIYENSNFIIEKRSTFKTSCDCCKYSNNCLNTMIGNKILPEICASICSTDEYIYDIEQFYDLRKDVKLFCSELCINSCVGCPLEKYKTNECL